MFQLISASFSNFTQNRRNTEVRSHSGLTASFMSPIIIMSRCVDPVQPRRICFSVPMRHAVKFPAVPFIKSFMVCQKIYPRKTSRPQITDRRFKQFSGYSATAVAGLRIYRAGVREQILPVMEIVFDNAQSPGYPAAADTQIPSVFSFAVKIQSHTAGICFLRHIPHGVEPSRGSLREIRSLPQRNEFISVHRPSSVTPAPACTVFRYRVCGRNKALPSPAPSL